MKNLSVEAEEVISKNKELKAGYEALVIEARELKQQLLLHSEWGFPIINEYLNTQPDMTYNKMESFIFDETQIAQ